MNALAAVLGIQSGADTERLAEALKHGIQHNILNAKFHEQEARIIAEAGRKGAVTVATNMAGRGVDILLGGTHYKSEDGEDSTEAIDTSFRRGGKNAVRHVVGKNDATADPDTVGPAGAGTIALIDEPHDIAREREEVRERGGIYILGTERHEARRIDNQLRGRSGRQGDPGHRASTSRWKTTCGASSATGRRLLVSKMLDQWEEDQSVDTPMLSR